MRVPDGRAPRVLLCVFLVGCNSILGIENASKISEDSDLSDGQDERPPGFALDLDDDAATASRPEASTRPPEIADAATPPTGNAPATESCPAGWADCDGDPANGCETDLDSPDNCGACGNVCTSGSRPRCVEGACRS